MGSYDPSLLASAAAAAAATYVGTNSPPDAISEGAPQAPKMSKIGLHQIVRLRQMVQQWRKKAASNIDRTLQVMSPSGAKKLLRASSSFGRASSTFGRSSSTISGGVNEHDLPPEGYLAIYVGQERRRFVIRTEHINHPLLRGLLERTEEEFGLNQQGGLAIPACEIVLFEHMLWMVENQDVHALDDPIELREILDFYMHVNAPGNATTCLQEAKAPNSNIQLEPASAMSSGIYGRLHQ